MSDVYYMKTLTWRFITIFVVFIVLNFKSCATSTLKLRSLIWVHLEKWLSHLMWPWFLLQCRLSKKISRLQHLPDRFLEQTWAQQLLTSLELGKGPMLVGEDLLESCPISYGLGQKMLSRCSSICLWQGHLFMTQGCFLDYAFKSPRHSSVQEPRRLVAFRTLPVHKDGGQYGTMLQITLPVQWEIEGCYKPSPLSSSVIPLL